MVSACCMQLARTSYVVLARSPGRCSSIYRITSFDNPHSLGIFCFEGLWEPCSALHVGQLRVELCPRRPANRRRAG